VVKEKTVTVTAVVIPTPPTISEVCKRRYW
jgi:hypothetical protein